MSYPAPDCDYFISTVYSRAMLAAWPDFYILNVIDAMMSILVQKENFPGRKAALSFAVFRMMDLGANASHEIRQLPIH